MKQTLILMSLMAILYACGGGKTSSSKSHEKEEEMEEEEYVVPDYDPSRGEGKWNASNINLGSALDPAMAGEGEKVYTVKCSSCHKLSDERLVGPGWKGVTQRRKPEWIMNFITNPDPMITKDPALQAQLELCLVRMPNQNLTDTDARNILEYMRQNDGVK